MESNFRAVYRITLMGEHQSLTENERMRKSRCANGRNRRALSMPDSGTGGNGGVLAEERDEFFFAQGAQGGERIAWRGGRQRWQLA